MQRARSFTSVKVAVAVAVALENQIALRKYQHKWETIYN